MEVRLYFLSVKVWVGAIYDTVLHQKRSTSGDEGSCHGSSGIGSISPAGSGADDVYAGGSEIRFWQGKFCVSLPGKGSQSVGGTVVGGNCDWLGSGGGNGESGFFRRDKKAGGGVDGVGRREPKVVCAIDNSGRDEL